MTTMNAVNSANIARTSSQLQIVLAWKVPKPIRFMRPSTAAVIPFDSSHGRNAARKKTRNKPPMNALITVAADRTSNSRISSPSRYSSRVMGLVPDRISPGYAVPRRRLRAVCSSVGVVAASWRRRAASGGSVPVVVTDGFEREPHRVEPEGGGVRRRVLREGSRRVQAVAPDVEHHLMRRAHVRSGRDHEGQVLQAGPVPLVADLGGGIEEEVRPGLGGCGPVGELVLLGEERFEAEDRQETVVVGASGLEVGDVDAEMSEHRCLRSGQVGGGGRH